MTPEQIRTVERARDAARDLVELVLKMPVVEYPELAARIRSSGTLLDQLDQDVKAALDDNRMERNRMREKCRGFND